MSDHPAPAPRLDLRLVPAALTSWLVTAAGIVWSLGVLAAASGLLLAGCSGLLCWRVPRVRVVGAGLAAAGVVAAGFGCAVALRADAVRQHPISSVFGTVADVTVNPSESAVPVGSRRLMFRATLLRVAGEPASGRVLVFASTVDFADLAVGRPMAFRARIGRPARRDLSVATLTAAGEPELGRAGPVQQTAHAVRARFAATAGVTLPVEQAALLPALVLGDTSAITPGTNREFRAAGLTHLMAVSGANVTIVCGAVLLAARLVGPRAAVGLAAVTLVAFVVVVQPTASVLRAAVMGAIALLGVVSSRRRQAIPSLSASVLVLMATAPQLAVDVGFALSVVATAALVVIAPAWSGRLVAHGWPKPLADALCVALAAQLVTAPLIAGIWGQVSLVSAAANLAAAPMVVPVTVLGSAAAALCGYWPAAAQLLIRFTGPELWWVGRVAHWAAAIPAATMPVPSGVSGVFSVGAVALLVTVLWRSRPGRLVVAAALACLLAWSLSSLSVVHATMAW